MPKSTDIITTTKIKKKSLFDHVKEIRQVQNPDYYKTLSDDDKKSFNHFMIVRALSMDASIVEDMAQLYQIHDKIPSAQFYQLLIAIVPKSTRFFPWVKSKKIRYGKELVGYIGKRFKIPNYQANEYLGILISNPNGTSELQFILQSFGLNEIEMQNILDAPTEY
jgi:hypothetical protein